MLDTGIFGVSDFSISTLSYRNLMFGNIGRKQNRRITEQIRIAKSIFATQTENDVLPSAKYNQSSAFVYKTKQAQIDESERSSLSSSWRTLMYGESFASFLNQSHSLTTSTPRRSYVSHTICCQPQCKTI
jgi:hypothetical protein